ncbi:MAG: hypothetical protein AAF740_01575 [Bacteroidota bacterium]
MQNDWKRLLEADIQSFLKENEGLDPTKLLLQAQKYPSDWSLPLIATQLKARQKAKQKLPTFCSNSRFIFPDGEAVEQSSSEQAAKYKASLYQKTDHKLVDLTGGLGMDDFMFSKQFSEVHHIERDAFRSELAAHNFSVLGATNIYTHHTTAEEFLQATESVSDHFQSKESSIIFYLDPVRRTGSGRVFQLSDCEPNIVESQDELLQKGTEVLLKTAPLLDIAQALRELKQVSEIIVVAVAGECKEVLYRLQQNPKPEIRISTVHLLKNGDQQSFSCVWEAEAEHSLLLDSPKKYLYLPNPAIMKAGVFKSLSAAFQLPQLHQHAHAYTHEDFLKDFPGKTFCVNAVLPFDRKKLKKHFQNTKANVLTRHFPLSVAEIRKRFSIASGGETFLLFTTLKDERRMVLELERV